MGAWMRERTNPSMLTHYQDIGFVCPGTRHGVLGQRSAVDRRREILRSVDGSMRDANTLTVDEIAAEICCRERDGIACPRAFSPAFMRITAAKSERGRHERCRGHVQESMNETGTA
jgi:hypothetical protein